MFENFSEMMLELFAEALWETVLMVGVSGLLGGLFGIPLGVFLRLTDKGGVLENTPLNVVVGGLVNAARSTPFIILLVAIIPFTRWITGTSTVVVVSGALPAGGAMREVAGGALAQAVRTKAQANGSKDGRRGMRVIPRL